jgi:hypothetical protein
MRKLSILIVLVGFALPVFPDEPADIELTAKRVALFKNGYAIVNATAPLPSSENQPRTYRIKPLPDASLGSLWVHLPEGLVSQRIRSVQSESSSHHIATDITQLLQANLSQSVEVLVGDEWIQGTLKSMPTTPVSLSHPQPHARHLAATPPTISTPTVALFDTEAGVRVVQVRWIQQVRFSDDPSLEFSTNTPVAAMELEISGAPAQDVESELGLQYIAYGLSWSPSYHIDLSTEETATISAKAVVINDLLDLDGVQLELITGYPHLEFATVKTSLSLQPLSVFLQSMSQTGQQMRNVILNNALAQRSRYEQSDFGGPSTGQPPADGQSTEDLFFYDISDVSLAKGERGYFSLFQAEVPYRHCYTWSIPDFIDENRGYHNRAEDQERKEIVWHAVRLKNTTDKPWTTAPGMTAKDGRVLGQDTLHYTTPGTSTDLKITQALAIQAEQHEVEIERQTDAARFHGSRYDLVTVQGELNITNRKDRAITLSIEKMMSGELVEADGEPTTTKLAKGLRRVNPRVQLLWEIPIEPGEANAAKLIYTYKVYVRN